MAASGEYMEKPDVDLLIIGAGPAGLSAAQYGARAGLDVLALEQTAPGGQALLIDRLENYPGNLGRDGGPPPSGWEFAEDLRRQAEGFGAKILSAGAVSLRKEGDLFRVELGKGESRSAYAVIVAAGAVHRKLEIPGEEALAGRGVSYCASCDGPFFKGKKIFVVGGGDAACDEAQYLARLSPHIVVIHRREKFRAQKALADRVLANPHIKVCFNTRMREIRGEAKVSSVVLEDLGSGERREEEADAVFVFVGTSPQTKAAGGAKTDENGYIITDQGMESSIPGLFAAGDVRASPFRQVVVACGEGAVAAHSAAAYIDRLWDR
jgi:thioredoxin reductase (NADPH)